MQRTTSSSKRKRTRTTTTPKKVKVGLKKSSMVKKLPFPTYPRPTPEECRLVRDALMDFHGFPDEFLKYRRRIIRNNNHHPDDDSGSGSGSGSLNSNLNHHHQGVVVKLKTVLDGDDEEEEEEESVLDGLVNTLLSQNTTEVNSRKAFFSLKSTFPTWENVLAADLKCIENAIKCGGLAVTKAACIKSLLTGLLERKGKLCLEHLRGMAVDDIKAELLSFKGIGPKTGNVDMLDSSLAVHYHCCCLWGHHSSFMQILKSNFSWY